MSINIAISRRTILACTVSLLTFYPTVYTQNLYAQEDETEESDTHKTRELKLDEIVVMGRQRAESLSDVPLTINVFNSQTIRRAQIRRPADFIALTPNTGFSQTTNVGDTAIHVRGIIQPRDTEPPVALIIDGVLTPNPNALNRDLVDIEQIEFLKGPQGALYGRNAIGGAIIITTKKPTNEFESAFEVGYGNGKEAFTKGMVSGPLIENKLFYRVSASFSDREGYYDNITLNQKIDPFTEKQLRGRLIWNANEKLTIDARAEIARVNAFAINFNAQGDIFTPFLTPNPTGVFKLAGGVDVNNTSQQYFSNVQDVNTQTRWDASLKADYDMDATGTLSVTLSHSKLTEPAAGDGPVNFSLFNNPVGATELFLTPDNQLGYSATTAENPQIQNRNQSDSSIEVRLTSPDDQKLRYIAGVYFTDINREIILATVEDKIGVVIPNPINGPETESPTRSLKWDDNQNQAYAGFLNLSYDIIEDLELYAAIRYDIEKRKNINKVPNIQTPFEGDDPSALLSNIPDGDPSRIRTQTFKKAQPKFSIRYRITPDHTIYATYGLAFRSGGFNPQGVRALILAVDQPSNTTVQDLFKSETSESYEVGAKTSWFDGRLTINGALFYTEVKNAHNFQFFPISFSRVVTLVDKVNIKGLELEARASVTENFNIFASLGITDTEIKENLNDPSTVGNKQAYTPDYTVNAGGQYVIEMDNDAELILRADYQRIGPQYFNIENTPGTRRNPVDLVNARISYETEKWEFSLWGKNILDKRYNTDSVVLPASFGNLNFVTRAIPATYGVTAKFMF